jgi:hypothetical protein
MSLCCSVEMLPKELPVNALPVPGKLAVTRRTRQVQHHSAETCLNQDHLHIIPFVFYCQPCLRSRGIDPAQHGFTHGSGEGRET